ncbi:MAG: hypothetical protein PV340_03765 [Wolbachia sp.]|nr:hypothetical protein [Wolbachia sp.]MDD9336779.1 hypothetical protein [Wolbachia sp.]
MLDVFSIEGVYCMDGQCDTYTGEVSFNDVRSGKFSLNSDSGKEATINLNIVTCGIGVSINDQNGEIVKREIQDIKFITRDDGSWYISEKVDNDKFEITIKKI